MNTRPHALALLLALAVTGSAGCGGGGGGSSSQADAPGFVTGSAEAEVVLPRDGCLDADVVLVTETGVRLVLESGTCLRTQDGTVLQGPVLVRIDDGGLDVAWLAAEAGEPLHGTLRVGAALVVAGGDPVPVNVVFEPAAYVDLTEVIDPDLAGSWRFLPYFVRGVDGADEPPPPLTAQVGGEPPSGIRWKPFGASVGARGEPGQDEVITHAVPTSTLTGARLDDPTIPPPGFVFDGHVIFEKTLGPVGTDYPRLCCLNIANPDTSVSVLSTCWPPGLFLPGQARVKGIPGDPHQFLVQIVEVGGQRVLRVSSRFQNEFRLHLRYCDGPDPGDERNEGEDGSGSEDEADLAGPYLGDVEVRITGCGGYFAAQAAWRQVQAAAGGWLLAPVDRVTVREGLFTVRMRVGSWTTSVRNFADLLPPAWTVTPGGRLLVIQVPCPPPTILSSSYGAQVLHVLDPVTLAVVRTSQTLPGAPDDAVLSFDGTAYVGSQAVAVPVPVPGTITEVDTDTGDIIDTVPLPPLASGLGMDPNDQEVYGATGLGDFFAFSRATNDVAWSVPGLVAGQRFSDVAVAPDGAFAYVGAHDGAVYEIDLLRRALGRQWLLDGATGVAVNAPGNKLVVVDDQNGGVQVIDLTFPSPPFVISGPTDTFSPLFAPGSDDLLLAHFSDGEIRVVAASTGLPTDTASGAGTLCITSFLPGAGLAPLVIAANYGDDTLTVGELADPTMPLGLTTVPTEPEPNLVRVAGR
jgi:hypothetical protein